jgi:hypothetical protein
MNPGELLTYIQLRETFESKRSLGDLPCLYIMGILLLRE